jgi:hypothetical protein
MATAKTTSRARRTKKHEAATLLRAEQVVVDGLFQRFDMARTTTAKRKIVAEICTELVLHVQVEEDIFYPEVKAALHDKQLIHEAEAEHQNLKDLIRQLQKLRPDDDFYDLKVKLLGECVKHHVREEHFEMFPKANRAALDMVDLGDRMAAHKNALRAHRAPGP